MKAGKQILMLTHEFPPYPGNVGRYCWNLAAAAARMGHEATVLAPAHASYRSDRYRDPPGVEVVHFAGDQFHFRELPALEQLVQDTLTGGRWDVVHAADWPMIAALRNLEINVPERIASLHGSDVLLLRHSLRARLARVHRALKRFTSLTCSSTYTASLLQDAFSDLAEIRVARPGVGAQWFDAPSPEAVHDYRQRVGCNETDRIVLTVAPMDEQKGHLVALAAIAKLPERDRRGLVYVCAGPSFDPEYDKLVLDTAATLNIRTVLTGPLSDAEQLAAYSTASVLALCGQESTQKVGGFELVLLEGAAQGLPAVVTNVHALPEMVVNGTTGWICHGNDAGRLAVAMSIAMAGSGANDMREACISHARQYTWDRCAELTYGENVATVAAVA